MSKTLYEATILQLRGRALEAYAALDMLFTNPTSVPDHTQWAAEIIKHTRILTENENAMITLQNYFGPRFAPPPPVSAAPPPPPPPPEPQEPSEPMGITPDMSPTMRKALNLTEVDGIKKGKKKTKKSKKE